VRWKRKNELQLRFYLDEGGRKKCLLNEKVRFYLKALGKMKNG
jgi:hypothetical protein